MSYERDVRVVVVEARVKMTNQSPGWRLGRVGAVNEATGEAITILLTRTQARVVRADGSVDAVDA